MIDHDLSSALHSLAATIDDHVDMAALRRRIATQNRRTTATRVGVAGVGMAAAVGGFLVVRDERNRPAATSLQTASSPASGTAGPSALPDCLAALDEFRTSQTTADSLTVTELQAAKQAAADLPPEFEFDFKGVVSILGVDSEQITFHVEAPTGVPDGTATIDANTRWTNGAGPLDEQPTLHPGDRIGLATQTGTDGTEHVEAIDLTASATPDATPTPETVPDKQSTADTDPLTTKDTTILIPGDSVPPGPTGKTSGTITAIDGASITLSVDHLPGEPGPTAVVVTATSARFFAGEAQCTPASLTVGMQAGVGYHLDADTVVIDDIALVP